MRQFRILLMMIGALVTGGIGLCFMFINDTAENGTIEISVFRVGIMLLVLCIMFMIEMYQKLKE